MANGVIPVQSIDDPRWDDLGTGIPLRWWLGLLAGLLLGALIIGAFLNGRVFYLAGLVMVGLPLMYVFFRYPHVWIYTVIGSQAFWLQSTDRGLSLIEIMLVGFYVGGLLIWFVWHLAARRKHLIRGVADFLVLIVFGLCVVNYFVAMGNGVDTMAWLREFLLVSFILFYFPIREHINTDRRMRIMLGVLLGVCAFLAGMAIQNYMRATTDITYAFELVTGRSAKIEMAFVASTIGAAAALLYSRRLIPNVFYFACTIVFFSTLVATFSRSFWVSSLIGLFLLFVFATSKLRVKITILGLVAIVVGIIGMLTVVGPEKSDLLLGMLQVRVESIIEADQSVSLAARGNETKEALDHISRSPLLGYGFGKHFWIYDLVMDTYGYSGFLHNGYCLSDK